MRRELKIFFTAVMFYTRIPCPKWVDHDPELINLSTRYFPLIGWIVGIAYAGIVLIADLIFQPAISILLGLIASVLLTGAFHEDGFADMCDGFGGGWTKEKILMIMKDSRVGTYGVVGLILLLSLKVTVSSELVAFTSRINFLLLIVASHSLSRTMAVIIIYFQLYAREDQDSKAKPIAQGISEFSFLIASLFGLLPLLYLVSMVSIYFLLPLLPMLILTFYLMRYYKKWIGGYTGDCLGATQQLTEMVFLISALAVWKFI